MKILIVGLGVQGQKRKKLLNKKLVFATVDTKNKSADFKNPKNMKGTAIRPIIKPNVVIVSALILLPFKYLAIGLKKNSTIGSSLLSTITSSQSLEKLERRACEV